MRDGIGLISTYPRSRDRLPILTEAAPCCKIDYRQNFGSRLNSYLELLLPEWSHRRDWKRWERRWRNPDFSPFWKTDQPPPEVLAAVESGWFPKGQRIIDLGCGNGEISRWLSAHGLNVQGIDYSAAAIENCRRLSAGNPNAPSFEVADLCRPNLRLEPALNLIDRGCFHRIVARLRPLFALNVARATLAGGHFLLLAGTFQDVRLARNSAVRSEQELREHVAKIFGTYFIIERSEPTAIKATEGNEDTAALAFWMIRKPGRQ